MATLKPPVLPQSTPPATTPWVINTRPLNPSAFAINQELTSQHIEVYHWPVFTITPLLVKPTLLSQVLEFQNKPNLSSWVIIPSVEAIKNAPKPLVQNLLKSHWQIACVGKLSQKWLQSQGFKVGLVSEGNRLIDLKNYSFLKKASCILWLSGKGGHLELFNHLQSTLSPHQPLWQINTYHRQANPINPKQWLWLERKTSYFSNAHHNGLESVWLITSQQSLKQVYNDFKNHSEQAHLWFLKQGLVLLTHTIEKMSHQFHFYRTQCFDLSSKPSLGKQIIKKVKLLSNAYPQSKTS